MVHKSGEEVIPGYKIFNSEIERSVINTGGTVVKSYYSSSFAPGDFVYIDRFNNVSGNRRFFIRCWPAGDGGNNKILTSIDTLLESGSSANFCGVIYMGRDTDDIDFVSCTSTSELRTVGGDILTRDWIPKDTRIVHTAGAESIDGIKTFTKPIHMSSVTPDLYLQQTGFTKGTTPTENKYWSIVFYPANGIEQSYNLGSVYMRLDKTSGASHLIFGLNTNATSSEAGSQTAVEYMLNGNTRAFFPLIDNNVSLGKTAGGNNRWSVVYAATGSINTSDERQKSYITNLPDSVLDCWESVDFKQFKFNDSVSEKGDGARLHVGLIAQEIDRSFKKSGLDVSDYGLFCFDEWDASEAVYDDNGNLEVKAQEAGNMYSLRYEEALCMEAAYNRREVKRLKERLARLEEQLAK